MTKQEVTTTGTNIPKNYFPNRRKKDRKKKVTKMDEALLAVELVEHGFDHKEALTMVLEKDPDKAAKKMAMKAAPDDPEKQKELEAKYKEQMKSKMKKESGKR